MKNCDTLKHIRHFARLSPLNNPSLNPNRYYRAEGMKKSLANTEKELKSDDYREATKRASIKGTSRSIHDPVVESMLRSSERRLPKFTTKGDKTILAFSHYSPWAVAQRMHPFATLDFSKPAKDYNLDFITGSSMLHEH